MDKSYWIDSYKNFKNNYKKLEGNSETEVTIIGGGLTGLTCAYYLSKSGKKVTVLEKNEIASGTSRKYNSKNNKSTWIVL